MGRKNRKKNTTLTTQGSDDAPKARRSSKGGDPESKTASARTPKFKGVTSGMRVCSTRIIPWRSITKVVRN